MSNDITITAAIVCAAITAFAAFTSFLVAKRTYTRECDDFIDEQTRLNDEIIAAMPDPPVTERTLQLEAEFKARLKELEAEHDVEFISESVEVSLRNIRKVNELARMESMPPKKARLAMLFWVPKGKRDAIEGDIMETYRQILDEHDKKTADRFYRKELARTLFGMVWDCVTDAAFGRLIDIYRKSAGG